MENVVDRVTTMGRFDSLSHREKVEIVIAQYAECIG